MEDKTRSPVAVEVKVLWQGSPIEVRQFEDPEAITVGATKRCDLFLAPDGLPFAEYPIVRRIDGGFVLTFTDEMVGEVRSADRVASLDELVASGRAEKDPDLHRSYRCSLTGDAVAEVGIGSVTLEVRAVPARERLPRGLLKGVDQSIVNAALVTIFGAFTLITSFALFPFDLASKSEAAVRHLTELTGVKYIARSPQEPVQVIPERRPAGEEHTLKAAGGRGIAGSKTAREKDGKIAFAPAKTNLRDRLLDMGLIAIIRKNGANFLTGRIATPDAIKDAMGHLDGTKYADATGLEGLSDRGTGPGGGGDRLDSIGLDLVGIPGVPGKGGDGPPVTSLGPKKPIEISPIDGGVPTVTAGLDKDLVRRVVRAHRAEVKYCYEKGLAARPGLWGKVSVTFVVGDGGRVQSARINEESTLGDPEVEGCIAAKVRGWIFPEPKGGGVVVVTYPFLLRRE